MLITNSAPLAHKKNLIAHTSSSDCVTLTGKSWTGSVADSVAAHPFRAIVDTVSLASTVGMATASGANASFFKGATQALGICHMLSGAVHGLAAMQAGSKELGVIAIGDMMAGGGHAALVHGLTGVGAGMVVFGHILSAIPTFSNSN